ncbi:glycine zipper 2TM domain-containing protein [Sphingomonas sp. ZT3P38]
MKIITLCSAIALAAIGSAPLAAQQNRDWRSNNSSSSWDRDAFWRGASEDPRQRISFLQQRIDRGVADRSLDRREARRAQAELNNIRTTVNRSRGRMSQQRRDDVLRRLDDLSRSLRWARQNDWDRGAVAGRDDDRRFATDYDASRYYREDPRYTERRLSSQDEVYRGSDGRYYCKRNDGTTGLIVGAIGGGILGNVIDGGRNRAAGTLLGGALGALAGKSIDQNNSDVRCR